MRFTRDDVREIAGKPDNDFLFGVEYPRGSAVRTARTFAAPIPRELRAWIRRSSSRSPTATGSSASAGATQPGSDRPGLFFMCLNADLERQFEFIQQTWMQAPSFHGLMDERDPILGSRHPGAQTADDGFSLPTREAPVRFKGMPEFVRTLGGGYFFMPGRSLLRFLAEPSGIINRGSLPDGSIRRSCWPY